MAWLGWLLGGGAGLGLALGVMLVRGPLALGLAGLGAGAAVVALVMTLAGDSFSRGFGLVYVGVGLAAAGLVAVPRALTAAGASPARELTAWGLGMALMLLVVLAGLGLDRLLTAVLPNVPKAQASFGLPGGLLVGTLLGLAVGVLLLRRSA
ncbi:hypothetical protein K7W42_16545 [Deinococcus sp. HMF7604]|uniref:hypothetical protein n=1 Tax=Deinococcus betulae TaxID=2873312 RepID=UPI001CCD393C|nr:hypothetical protein [Deinococcus betulae]MBZ9752459.1 hypothetical protein [Deinococcus betulae]